MTVGAEQRGMVAGDAVNTAPRVQSAATPGQVWVDETTRLLTTSAISYVDVGTHVMKGKADPVPLWAVRAPAGQGAVPQGRGHRPAGMVIVSGEPGVGKSRLGWEARVSRSTRWPRRSAVGCWAPRLAVLLGRRGSASWTWRWL